MATFRVRFKLNPGRTGIVIGKLRKQTESIEMFVRSLASDLGEEDDADLWLSKDFKDGSHISTCERQAVEQTEKCAQFDLAVEALARFRATPKSPAIPPFVSMATIDRFAALRQGLDADERVGIATFSANGRPKRWTYIDRLHLDMVADSIDKEAVYVGSVMGTTYEWIKGAKEPYLTIRELNTGELIRCIYDDRDYSQVATLFQKKTAIVVIGGALKYDRVTGKTQVVDARSFDLAPAFDDGDFEAFFGCAPGLTGELSTDQFIQEGRDDEE